MKERILLLLGLVIFFFLAELFVNIVIENFR